ncbi:hypothetical protein XENTR_v10015827 [Xenopus tropicalis]|nr:hypothetical protein XENTR_v10015827 [Xenopus tropicalis]
MSSFCLKLISKFHYNLPLYQACQEVPGYSRGTRLVKRYQSSQEVPGYSRGTRLVRTRVVRRYQVSQKVPG